MVQGSPGRKLRKGLIFHGRGLLLKSRDDDLVLFNEMQKHETAVGDADKNEYNWLLTPPATPQFSLEDDGAQPVNTSRATGRTRSNLIPRQLTNAKTDRASSSLNSSVAPKSKFTLSRLLTPTLQSTRKGASPLKSSSSTKLRARQCNAPGFPKDQFETSKNSTDSCLKFGRRSTPPSAYKQSHSSRIRIKNQHVKASAGDGDDAGSSGKAARAFKQAVGGQDKVNQRRSKSNFKQEETCEESDLSVADKTCTKRVSLVQETTYQNYPSPEFYFHLLDSPVADNLNDEKSKKSIEVFFQSDRNGILNCSSIEDNHLQDDDVGHRDSSSGAAAQNSSNLNLEQQADHCSQDSQDTLESNCGANVADESPRKGTLKNFTMEETTNNVMLCNSIAQDLAYKVASIVIEKEMPATEASSPIHAHLVKSVSYRKNFRDICYKRIKYSKKLQKRRQEIDSNKAFKELGTNNARNKELVFSSDIMKSPKLESKCNCTVM